MYVWLYVCVRVYFPSIFSHPFFYYTLNQPLCVCLGGSVQVCVHVCEEGEVGLIQWGLYERAAGKTGVRN